MKEHLEKIRHREGGLLSMGVTCGGHPARDWWYPSLPGLEVDSERSWHLGQRSEDERDD